MRTMQTYDFGHLPSMAYAKELKDDVIVILVFNVYKRHTQFTKSLSSPV